MARYKKRSRSYSPRRRSRTPPPDARDTTTSRVIDTVTVGLTETVVLSPLSICSFAISLSTLGVKPLSGDFPLQPSTESTQETATRARAGSNHSRIWSMMLDRLAG
ncbi:hypothetical protein ACFX2J_043947 [Malus domestica]